jgi:hypothetical protein
VRQTDKDILIWLEKHKAITIKQCSLIFYEGEWRYDRARKKLKAMEEAEIIKSYQNSLTKEKVYFVEDKLSAHDIYIYDFYAKLAEYGSTDIKIKKFPRYLKGLIIPDALFEFDYDELTYFVLLEVDLTHFTSMSKFQLYEKLYRDGELKEICYGAFPQIVVMGVTSIQYESKNFDIVYLPFDLEGFGRVLGLIE